MRTYGYEAVDQEVIAASGIGDTGVPTIAKMTLMPVTPQWLPVEDAFETRFVEKLVGDARSFIKGLR